MVSFAKARMGEMIDDVKCPRCGEFRLELVGIHLVDIDKPLIVHCWNCLHEVDTNNNMEGLGGITTNG